MIFHNTPFVKSPTPFYKESMTIDPFPFLQDLFGAAVDAADPVRILPPLLAPNGLVDTHRARKGGRTVLVGAGKGVAQLAAAFETLWDDAGYGSLSGLVVTRYGFSADCRHVQVMEAAHPVPDANGITATEQMMALLAPLGADDTVIALICGGGSALLPAPATGLTPDDEIELNEVLLASGAPIGVMNTIRKQFSRVKGGRLAALAHPARVITLVVSDVPGDNPAHVASGPTVADTSNARDAALCIDRYGICLPARLQTHLAEMMERGSDAPHPEDSPFARDVIRVIASAAVSLEAASRKAEAMGIAACILSDSMEGEAREVAKVHGALAREIALNNRPFSRPVVLLSGGETTVTLTDAPGRGGPNTEFLLSLALCTDGLPSVSAISADTDGIDGSEDNAGALMNPDTIARLRGAGLDPALLLKNNDAWSAFHTIGDIFAPGPTGTNVNDFRAILIL